MSCASGNRGRKPHGDVGESKVDDGLNNGGRQLALGHNRLDLLVKVLQKSTVVRVSVEGVHVKGMRRT